MYICADLLQDLFLRLPLKSLGRFKSVSKEWKSILESKRFLDMNMSIKKSGKILIARNCEYNCGHLLPQSRFEAGQEFVSMHYDANKPSLSCYGLVCIPESKFVNVLNPCTGQLWRFHSPRLLSPRPNLQFTKGTWSTYFPGCCAMGFGRDNVQGHYKVVRIFVNPNYSDILDVDTGEWKKLHKPRSCKVDVGRTSACVNGKIYWLRIMRYSSMILALDLDTEEFHYVQCPSGIKLEAQIVNIGDRLAIAMPEYFSIVHEYELQIWTMMSAQEETWRKTHSISLACLDIKQSISFTPVTLSREGNVVFHDHTKRLFKYCQETNKLQSISRDICVVSPYVENLVSIHTKAELRAGITCPRRTKDWILSRVDEFLGTGKDLGSWIWKKKIKLLAIYLHVYLLYSCFSSGIEESMYRVVYLIIIFLGTGCRMPQPIGHIIMAMIMMKITDVINSFHYSERVKGFRF